MDFLYPIASFFLGFFAEKLLDKLLGAFSDNQKARKNRKTKLSLTKRRAIDAIFTEDIYPCVPPENVWTRESGKRLFLAFPESLKKELKSIEGTFAQTDERFCDFVLPGRTAEEVNSAIEAARFEIAEKFINREDGLYFNGDKLGIALLDSKSRTTDAKETPRLFVELYRTDHFTHRVISRAVEMLRLPPENINSQLLNSDLRWIRTSFGVSIILILKSTNQIILTHRSKTASFSNGKSWIYVSATEALSQSDIDEYETAPDLALCVKRGIKEELGIDKSMYRHDDIKFYDCFFETAFFQDGIVASLELSDKIMPQDILDLRAKDKRLEVQDIFFIDNTKAAIQRFISENQDNMRSQTIFALESYIATL